MKFAVIICLVFLCVSVSAQMVYKTVKLDGTAVYSDVPTDGAVPVKLSSMNSVIVPALNDVSKQATSKTNSVKQPKPEVQYTVVIRSPVAEQTLRGNSGEVMIDVDVQPKKSGKLQLVLDNQIVKTHSKSNFKLENVNRGAHTIQVKLLDNSGKILALSMLQTFYLQKASALINAK